MKQFFKGKKFKVVLFLIILSMVMVISGLFLGDKFIRNFSFLESISIPFQKFVSSISVSLNNVFSNLFTEANLKVENQKLIEENLNLKQQFVELNNIKSENSQLKEILELKSENPKFEFYQSSVISKDATSKFGDLKISGGSLDGIKERSPVISGNVIVGVVVEVFDKFSRVSTVLNPDLKISAYEVKTMNSGIVSGDLLLYKDSQCKIEYIDDVSSLTKGDIISTSGDTELFPKGLLIGSVDRIVEKENTNSFYLVINPFKDIKSISDITIIKSFD